MSSEPTGITAAALVQAVKDLGVTHVVWLPDSTLGQWDAALAGEPSLTLVRVCREGEAWGVAHGLYLGGARPLVVMQCTGLFESGDSLRCALYDYQAPLFALIGHRSSLNPSATDSARTFAEPMLKAFHISYRTVDRDDQLPDLVAHYRACQAAKVPGAVLIGEGRL